MFLYSIFYTIIYFPIIIASYLFFYLLLIYTRKAAWLGILIMCRRATYNTLKILNLFKLALIILVNLACFLNAIFFTFLRIFFYCISSYN